MTGLTAEAIGMMAQCGAAIVLPCKRGPMMVNRHDQIMTFALAAYGEFGEDEFDVIGRWLKPGMQVVDVGANIGTHSLAFAEMVAPGGGVISFEPIMCNFHLLCANIAMSGRQNIYPQRVMAGARDEMHMLKQIDVNQEANFGNVNAASLITEAGVPTPELKIDGLGLAACHLIKIDVEGSEPEVLEGATETMEKFGPLIHVECHDGDKNESRIQSLLRKHGYETYWLFNRLFRPNNYKGSKVAQGGHDRNILAVRPNQKHVAEGLEACSL